MASLNKIAIVSQTPGVREDMIACLAEAQVSAVVHEGEAFVPAADIVLIDQRALPAAQVESLLAQHAPRCILLTDHDDGENITKALARFPLSHIIGCNGRSWLSEFAVTAQKMASPTLWGLAAHLSPAAVIESRTVGSAAAINATIDELLGHVDLKASFGAAEDFLRQTANELLTNAVYNAPVDRASQQPKYEQTDRKEKIVLLPSETVEIAFGTDEDNIGIAVSDQFGRLTREKIVRHLLKCVTNTNFIEDKRGGAGAGLYLAFYTANQFVVNVEVGKRTEILCLLEKTKRYKHYRNRVTSFNYFTQAKGAA